MMLIRTLSFICVVVSALFFPVWVFALLTVLYAFVFSPYELLPIGVLIDAGFGSSGTDGWYWYTAVVSTALVVSAYLRPYFSFYRT